MSINSADPNVSEVMDMVLGDYLEVYRSGLEDQMECGDITPEEQLKRFIRFSKGCRKICETFGLDADVFDVDNLLASEFLCNHFKEGESDGFKNNC